MHFSPDEKALSSAMLTSLQTWKTTDIRNPDTGRSIDGTEFKNALTRLASQIDSEQGHAVIESPRLLESISKALTFLPYATDLTEIAEPFMEGPGMRALNERYRHFSAEPAKEDLHTLNTQYKYSNIVSSPANAQILAADDFADRLISSLGMYLEKERVTPQKQQEFKAEQLSELTQKLGLSGEINTAQSLVEAAVKEGSMLELVDCLLHSEIPGITGSLQAKGVRTSFTPQPKMPSVTLPLQPYGQSNTAQRNTGHESIK